MTRGLDKMLYPSWLKRQLPPPFQVAAPLVFVAQGPGPRPMTCEGRKAPFN
jgi:hypothetical protein